MSARSSFVSVLAGALLLAVGACGGEDANAGGPRDAVTALSCTIGQLRACPCAASTLMGMQACNANGNGYQACMGCPVTEAPQGSAPLAGAGGVGAAGASGAAGAAGVAGAANPMSGGTGGGTMTDSGMPDGMLTDASEPTPAGDVEPGVSCGVGLVSLCALDTQKCCTRSLEADTCIEEAAACTCSLPDCTVMEARCDGPEDCSDGEYCCGTLSQSGAGYDGFTCATQCDINGSQRAACHEQAPTCPDGLICANSQLLTNVQVCIDPATIQQ